MAGFTYTMGTDGLWLDFLATQELYILEFAFCQVIIPSDLAFIKLLLSFVIFSVIDWNQEVPFVILDVLGEIPNATIFASY